MKIDKKENLEKFVSIEQTEYLSDSMMNDIDAGGCTSCKKACQPGNQNSNVGNGNSAELELKLTDSTLKPALSE